MPILGIVVIFSHTASENSENRGVLPELCSIEGGKAFQDWWILEFLEDVLLRGASRWQHHRISQTKTDTALSAHKSLQNGLVLDEQGRSFKDCNLLLAEVGQSAGDRLARGTDDLSDFFVGQRDLDAIAVLVRTFSA